MGGSSCANCYMSPNGLTLKGQLVEKGGGFVSCRSPVFNPHLDLSSFNGIQLHIDGAGRTFKFAITCKYAFRNIREILYGDGGISWIASVPTMISGTTIANICFDELEPTIRARSIDVPCEFRSEAIIRFQLLHSKFWMIDQLNPGFQAGSIEMLFRSIRVF